MPNDAVDPSRKIVIIGNPDSRRVEQIAAAARMRGLAASVISYVDYLAGRVDVQHCVSDGCVVRIESPGENWEAEKRILRAGIVPMEARNLKAVSADEIERKPAQRGEIHDSQQWYWGFRDVLAQLEQALSGAADFAWMSHPQEIARAFDKQACYECWSARGLPIPHFRGDVDGYQSLRAAFPDRRCRLFVKLRYGFSAMGAVAVEWRDGRTRAITTVEALTQTDAVRLFVSKKIRVLEQESEIAWLIDTLAQQAILVEPWLPKARINGRPFDLRIVMIDGAVSHVVGRASWSPFTNLNLDAERVGADVVQKRLGDNWPDACSLCREAAAAFPRSLYTGLDLLVLPDRTRFVLLEANAFGDYLPRLTHAGQTTYEAEIAALLARRRSHGQWT